VRRRQILGWRVAGDGESLAEDPAKQALGRRRELCANGLTFRAIVREVMTRHRISVSIETMRQALLRAAAV
jgi:hypothetical protein